jgi:hypothetical protein
MDKEKNLDLNFYNLVKAIQPNIKDEEIKRVKKLVIDHLSTTGTCSAGTMIQRLNSRKKPVTRAILLAIAEILHVWDHTVIKQALLQFSLNYSKRGCNNEHQ